MIASSAPPSVSMRSRRVGLSVMGLNVSAARSE
jgi:hypothetical protein